MKTKLNLFCVCVLIALLLSTSTTVSIMFHSFTSAFKAGYESVEKGKDIHISDYKMICTLPTDLLEKTGSVTNVRTGEQASIIPIISMVEAPTKDLPCTKQDCLIHFGDSGNFLPVAVLLFDQKYQSR